MSPKKKAAIKDTSSDDCTSTVILHLSDLHFGQKMSSSERLDKKLVLEQFDKIITTLSPDWKPSHLCITGDISYKNCPRGFKDATAWLKKLTDFVPIDKKNLFICAGNHDLARACAKRIPQPQSESEVDNLITIARQDEFEKPFERYIGFLKNNLRLTKYYYKKNGSKKSFLFGVRFVPGLHFICYNPCFYDWDQRTKTVVMLGNKPLDWLEGEGLISARPNYDDICIVLMHCPRENWAEAERHSYTPERPATWHRVAKMSHLILTGHDHQKPEPFDSTGWGAYTSGIGTIYNGINFGNSFQLIRINREEQCFEQKPFCWDAGSRLWREPNDFQKKWPFKQIEEPEIVITSAQDQPSGERAKNLAEGLWECIRKRDDKGAEVLWNKDKDWYLMTKSKIHKRWRKHIDQCLAEINLMREIP